MDNNITEVRVLEVVPILEMEIDGENPIESSPPTFRLGQEYIPSQSNVHISDGEDVEECTEGSTSFVYSRQRTWETCSRSFIPEFSSYQNSIPETEQLIKHQNEETIQDGRSLPGSLINRRSLDRCWRFVPMFIMVVCAFISFIMAGVACKKIYDLSQETNIEDEGPKTSSYVLWGTLLIVLLGIAIITICNIVTSISRSLRNFSIQASRNGHNYNRYEEI